MKLLSVPLERRNLVGSDLAIVIAIGVHLFEAAILASTPNAYGNIPLGSMLYVFRHNVAVLVAFIGFASVAAIYGEWGSMPNRFRALLLLPQFSMIFITAVGALYLTASEHYFDYVYRSWQFIATDQMWRILLPLLYGTAVYARLRG